jgi:hypothetical protein
MGPGLGYEVDGFVVDCTKDFTLSMWLVPYSTESSLVYKWFASLGELDYQGMGLGSYDSRFSISYGNNQGWGMWAEEVIRASHKVEGHDKDVNHNYFGFYDWQYLALTKRSGIYGTGTDKLTLYINGREDRLQVSASEYTPGGDGVENSGFANNQALYVGGGLNLFYGYPVMSSNLYGIILVYDRALKPSELRQNFLATNVSKQYRGPTTPSAWRDRGYFYY